MKLKGMLSTALVILLVITGTLTCYAGGLIDGLKDVASDKVKDIGKDIGKDIVVGVISDAIGKDKSETKKETADKWESLIKDYGDEITTSIIDKLCEDALSWMNIDDDNVSDQMKNIYFTLTDMLGVEDASAEEIWKSVSDFAVDNEINSVVVTKLTVAAVVCSTMKEGFTREKAYDYIKNTIAEWIINYIKSEEEAETQLDNAIEMIKNRIK
ncbi:MAG: hypothetical protein HUJ72_12660 [Blautia sp.]|nr:hypothetical protein [Blautia sp.]